MTKTGIAIAASMAVLALAGCQPSQSSQRTVTELCTQTINAYAHSRDSGDVDAFGDVFTSDATFTMRGETQTGRDAIVESMQSRLGTTVSRHINGSIMIDELSSSEARGQTYVTVYVGDGQGTPPFALTEDKLFGIATYKDKFIIEDGICRIADREVVITFAKLN